MDFKKVGSHFELGQFVVVKHPENVQIGNHVRIADFCRISSICEIGDYCEIAAGAYIIGGLQKYKFVMKGYSSLAFGVRILLDSNDYVNHLVTHSFPNVPELHGDIIMEKYTGVGANSVIMPDNHLPEGVTVGALSFVPVHYKFEPWTVYAGNPLRPIKKRNKQSVLSVFEKNK